MHVTLESIVQYATLGTLLIGLVSLVVWARIYHRQVNTQIFIEISACYAKLRSFPAGLWARPDSGHPLPERNDEFTAYVIQYLSMLVFAHVLHERRYLGTIYGPSCGLNINEQERIPCLNASGTWSKSNLRCTRIL